MDDFVAFSFQFFPFDFIIGKLIGNVSSYQNRLKAW